MIIGCPENGGTNRGGAAIVAPAPAELELNTVVKPTVVGRVVEASVTVLSTGFVVTGTVSLAVLVSLVPRVEEIVWPE